MTVDLSQPFFSIIIPAYNVVEYIEESLRSILCSTIDGYEIVVVDDGSVDGTGDLCQRFVEDDSRITLLRSRRNRGPLFARRTGVAHARGKYCVFLDADDMLYPDALQIFEACTRKTSADIVVGGFLKDTEEAFCPDVGTNRVSRALEGARAFSVESFREFVLESKTNSLWGKAIRRDLFDLETDYSAYEGMRHGEDLLQLLPIVDEASIVCITPIELYFYRTNELQGTARFRREQIKDIKLLCERLLEYGSKWSGAEGAAYRGCTASLHYLLEIVYRSERQDEERFRLYEDIRRELIESGVIRVRMSPNLKRKWLLLLALRYRHYRALDVVLMSYEWTHK